MVETTWNSKINTFIMMNVFTHHYHLGESTFIFRIIKSLIFFLIFQQNVSSENRIASDGTPHTAASHLELYSLPLKNYKKNSKLLLEIPNISHMVAF